MNSKIKATTWTNHFSLTILFPLISMFVFSFTSQPVPENPSNRRSNAEMILTDTTADSSKIYEKVEIESEYPGGVPAWQQFLSKNLHYPDAAVNNEIQGDVIVQFIVDVDGAVSDVKAISGPVELRVESIRVIKKSGKWIPAMQNGKYVKSYKKQPFKYRLEVQQKKK
jgi:hypothetical protein